MLENYYRELVCFLNAKLGNRQVAESGHRRSSAQRPASGRIA
jgi:hypothetical protein